MKTRSIFACLAFTLLAAARAPAPGEDCSPGPEGESCMGAEVRALREAYGLPAIAELAAEGVEVRRTFFVTGPASNVGALSFIRRPGERPRMSFQIPAEGGRPFEPIGAEMSPEAWRQVIDRSRALFDDVAERAAARSTQMREAPTCFHSWSYVIEAADAGRPGSAGAGDGSGERCSYSVESASYSSFLAELAVRLLPACEALAAEHYRDAPNRLQACARLRGNRLAAAAIVNAAVDLDRPAFPQGMVDTPEEIERLRLHRQGVSRRRLRALFAPGIVLRREGREISGREAVADEWRRLRARHRGTYLAWTSATGASADRAEFQAILYHVDFVEDEPELRYFNAPMVVSFLRARNGRFRIERITLGAFERQRS